MVVPVYADVAMTRACVESVLACSGEALGLLIIVDDCGPEREAMVAMLRALRDEHACIRLLENETNQGFVTSVNRGISLRARDVVILNSDTRVTEGWLGELLEVAASNERIGAVCPLSNNATLCSVPELGRGVPPKAVDVSKLELEGLPRWTEVPTGVGFCMLLRDQMLKLVGGFDPAYGRGYNEENDWCQRIQALGFVVARANRAFVYHLGQVSFGSERNALDVINARRLHARYPHYLEQNRSFEAGPHARVAAIAARRSLGKLKVCVDVSHVVAPRIHGTAAYAVSLVEAMAELEAVDLTARVANEAMGQYFLERGVPIVDRSDGREFDVVHHPSQVYEKAEAARLFSAAGHVVLTWQDLIAYRSPSALKEWQRVETFRALTWACLQAAQGIIAISESAKRDLVETFGLGQVDVVHLGVEAPTVVTPTTKYELTKPYFLVLGSDYPHKNLHFALEAARFAGVEVVFAGPPSRVSGAFFSASSGARYLGELPAEDVGFVLQGAQGLIFPSTYEGFGLPMLEAMALGVPVIALGISAMPEVAGRAAVILDQWSPGALAHAMKSVLVPATRAELVARGLERVKTFTWRQTAERTLAVYDRVASSPSSASLRARDALRILLTGDGHEGLKLRR